MEYVISDTHFFHEQLLGVDQVLVEAWNARVK